MIVIKLKAKSKYFQTLTNWKCLACLSCPGWKASHFRAIAHAVSYIISTSAGTSSSVTVDQERGKHDLGTVLNSTLSQELRYLRHHIF